MRKAKESVPLPPIRNKVDVEMHKKKKDNEIFQKSEVPQKSMAKSEKELKRDITPMFDYYKAWDKFAADEEDKLEK